MLKRRIEVMGNSCLVPGREDCLVWIHDNNGVFSVKKLTGLLSKGGGEDVDFVFDEIWGIKVPPRVRNFLR